MDKEKVTEDLVRQNGNQAAAVMADYAGQGGQGGGGSVPKLSDFAIAEPLTLEETALWVAANGGAAVGEGYKLNKKVLEKLAYFNLVDGDYYLVYANKIEEFDGAGNILAIMFSESYMAKSSSLWDINVPDSASDDYFYFVRLQGPK